MARTGPLLMHRFSMGLSSVPRHSCRVGYRRRARHGLKSVAHGAGPSPTRRVSIRMWAGVLFLLAIASAARGDEPWQQLFNGRDLSGWEVVGGEPGGWKVEDGTLRTDGAGGWLSSAEEYADFELTLEFKLAPGSNSGVFLRAPREGHTSRVGMELQLIDDSTDAYGPLEPWQLTGSLYHVQAARGGAFTAAERWQTLRVLALGRRLRVWLNAQDVLDVDLDGFPAREAEHSGLKRTQGYLGLQNYGGRGVEFRHLRVRRL